MAADGEAARSQPDVGFVEAVEAFCAEHAVNPREICYDWSPKLFDMFYLAFKRRKTVEELTARKLGMTNALHSNSAFYKVEDGPNIRDRMITDYSDKIDEIIVAIYSSKTVDEIEAEAMSDPFIAAIDLGQQIVETKEQKEEQMRDGVRKIKQFDES